MASSDRAAPAASPRQQHTDARREVGGVTSLAAQFGRLVQFFQLRCVLLKQLFGGLQVLPGLPRQRNLLVDRAHERQILGGLVKRGQSQRSGPAEPQPGGVDRAVGQPVILLQLRGIGRLARGPDAGQLGLDAAGRHSGPDQESGQRHGDDQRHVQPEHPPDPATSHGFFRHR
jgi:hypothetical protein